MENPFFLLALICVFFSFQRSQTNFYSVYSWISMVLLQTPFLNHDGVMVTGIAYFFSAFILWPIPCVSSITQCYHADKFFIFAYIYASRNFSIESPTQQVY